MDVSAPSRGSECRPAQAHIFHGSQGAAEGQKCEQETSIINQRDVACHTFLRALVLAYLSQLCSSTDSKVFILFLKNVLCIFVHTCLCINVCGIPHMMVPAWSSKDNLLKSVFSFHYMGLVD